MALDRSTRTNNTTAVSAAITAGETPAPSPSPLLDPVAAGAHIGGSEKPINVLTLADWRCKGTGPAYIKVGRLIRYRLDDLDAWLDQGRVTPGRV